MEGAVHGARPSYAYVGVGRKKKRVTRKKEKKMRGRVEGKDRGLL
jgi:hypothetical protein